MNLFRIVIAFFIFVVLSANLYSQKNINEKIYDSYVSGKFDKTIKLLDKGINLNYSYNKAKKVLLLASKDDNDIIVKKIVQQKVDVNLNDDEGLTPLFYAILNKNYQLVKYLIKNDANIYFDKNNNKVNKSALFWAIDYYDKQIFSYLISNANPLILTSRNGTTLLHYACDKKNTEAIKILIEEGVDFYIKDASGRNCIQHAEKTANLSFINYLYELEEFAKKKAYYKLIEYIKKENWTNKDLVIDTAYYITKYDNKTYLKLHEYDKTNQRYIVSLIDKDGKFLSKGTYKSLSPSVKDGVFYYYNEIGKLERQKSYKDNILHGSWIEYNENGEVVSTNEFYKGERINLYMLDEIVSDGNFKMAEKLFSQWEIDSSTINIKAKESMYKAISKDNKQGIVFLMSKGLDINAFDSTEELNYTMYAIKQGRYTTADYFTSIGGKIDDIDINSTIKEFILKNLTKKYFISVVKLSAPLLYNPKSKRDYKIDGLPYITKQLVSYFCLSPIEFSEIIISFYDIIKGAISEDVIFNNLEKYLRAYFICDYSWELDGSGKSFKNKEVEHKGFSRNSYNSNLYRISDGKLADSLSKEDFEESNKYYLAKFFYRRGEFFGAIFCRYSFQLLNTRKSNNIIAKELYDKYAFMLVSRYNEFVQKWNNNILPTDKYNNGYQLDMKFIKSKHPSFDLIDFQIKN